MAKIFVSFSKHDKHIASRVVNGLRKHGHTVLWDEDLLRPGLDWRVVLAQALRDAPILVSILTENSIASSYPMSELGAARVLGKLVIPILFDDIECPGVVADLHYLRATEADIDSIVDKVNTGMSQFASENKKVFIVHGQNEAKKLELKDFLGKIGLDPIILHQQNSLGKTIIEKFEYYAPQCAFSIVLLTPDDNIAPHKASTEMKWHARQNVILELGWFMAKLGRERVLLLHQGEVEIPSDISGVVYAQFTDSITEVSETIREQLKIVGLIS